MPAHSCPDVIDRGPNPLWGEVLALHDRVRELEKENARLRAALARALDPTAMTEEEARFWERLESDEPRR